MRVVQVLGVPTAESLEACRDCDAIVVALKSRSIPAGDAITLSLRSLAALKELGIERFYFKYCSTFDSTPKGNIGQVAEAMLDELGSEQTIFCPAFPGAGRTVYQGHLFVGDQLLSESGMQHHPLNPMTDANLVRVLAEQTSRGVGLLAHNDILSGNVQGRLAELRENDTPLVIVDACDDQHLQLVANGVADMPLLTGGSGLPKFLASAYRERGIMTSSAYTPQLPNVQGRSLVVAGSCSKATNAQVARAEKKYPVWRVDVPSMIASSSEMLDALRNWAGDQSVDQPLVIASTSTPDSVAKVQQAFGGEKAAEAIEQFLSAATRMLVEDLDVSRLVLAGGETSGAITAALDVTTMEIGKEICPGVPWTETTVGDRRLALALKSGNFGGEDFFEQALEMLP